MMGVGSVTSESRSEDSRSRKVFLTLLYDRPLKQVIIARIITL
jgi:hypothetical protein